ncbi:MAG: hypothetical protein WD768_18860 [Phycisphaeraceae bacterium]
MTTLSDFNSALQSALEMVTQLESEPARDVHGSYLKPFADLRNRTIAALKKCFNDAGTLSKALQPVWRDEVPKEVADLRTALSLMARRLRGSWANGWAHPISSRGGAPADVVHEFEQHHSSSWKMLNRLRAFEGVADTKAPADPSKTKSPPVTAVLATQWKQANEELDNPPAWDEVGQVAIAGLKNPEFRERMRLHWPTLSGLRVLATRVPALLIMEETLRKLGIGEAYWISAEFVAIHCRIRVSLHRLFHGSSAVDFRPMQAIAAPLPPQVPEWWQDNPGTRFLGRAGNSALAVSIDVLRELYQVCFMQWAPFDYDMQTHRAPEWAEQAASDDPNLLQWAYRGINAIRDLTSPAVTDPIAIRWEVDAVISLMRDEFERAAPETRDVATSGKKQRADSGSRLKADAQRDLVIGWLQSRGGFDGTYEEMSKALEKDTGLKRSATSLHRDLKGTKYQLRRGNPHQAAKRAGKVGREREAVADSGTADMPEVDAWTMPDDEENPVS